MACVLAVAAAVVAPPRVAAQPTPQSRVARTTDTREQHCPPAQHWAHSFPRAYLGSVFALVTTPDGRAADVRVDLLWGRWQHGSRVRVAPSRADLSAGGTELAFAKTGGVTGLNPDVVLVSSVPVCVRFGLGPEPRTPGLVVDANPGWDFHEMPLT